MTSNVAGPLTGFRVLTIENYLAGNYGSMLLGYFGAEVIKIEIPGVGDTLRKNGPYTETPVGTRSHGELRLMCGKKSVELDLTSEAGFDKFLQLLGTADVLWCNLKPDSLERIGVTNEVLEAANPHLVYTTLTGFGHADVVDGGPEGGRPAFDIIAQGMAGLQWRTPSADGRPVYNGLPLGDQVTSIFAAMGTVLALLDRDRTPGFRRVDVAMFDAMMCLNEKALALLSIMDEKPIRGASPTSAPYGAYPTSDGWLNIAVGGDPVWRRFCAAMERTELAEDPRYATNDKRVESLAEVSAITEQWTRAHTREEALARLSEFGVPAGPVYDVGDLLDSAQADARGMWLPINFGGPAEDPRFRVMGSPIKLSGFEPTLINAPHALGQDTDPILSELEGLEHGS